MYTLYRNTLLTLIICLPIFLVIRAEEHLPIVIKLKDSWLQTEKLWARMSENGIYQLTRDESYIKKQEEKPEPCFSEGMLSNEFLLSEEWEMEMVQVIQDHCNILWDCGSKHDGLGKEQLVSYQKYKVPFFKDKLSDSDEVEAIAFYHCGNDRYCIVYHRKRKEMIKDQERLAHEFWQIKFHAPCADLSTEDNEDLPPQCYVVCNDAKPISVKLKNTPLGEKVLKNLTGYDKEKLLMSYKQQSSSE